MAILYKYTFLNVSIQNRDSGRQKNDRGGGSIKKKFIKGRRSCFYQGKKIGGFSGPPDSFSSASPAERVKWYFAKSFCQDFAGHCATEIEAICSWRKVAKEIFKAKFFDCVHHARKTLARTACTLS